jgi:poly(A) polymerase
MKLPPQPWLTLPGTQAILAALGGAAETRIVGGAVRDALLGLKVTDVDLATRLTPATVVERLRDAGLRSVPTGIAHGTVTALAPDIAIEVTTLRRDIATDGRRATVAFTDDWREDAARRDFTINALYADPVSGEIFDYFGGEADLAARRVAFIGAPLERIAEDHLRILRFFRFHARFGGGAPDPAGLAACAARANDLMALSRERIQGELSKLLAVEHPEATVRLMLDNGIFRGVLPEVVPDAAGRLAALVAAETGLAALAPAWVRRLAALLPADADVLDRVAYRLKLSNADRRRLVLTAQPLTPDADIWRAAYINGVESVVDRLLVDGRGTAEIFTLLATWTRPTLPASGRDLIARGVPVGPDVSKRLARFESAWIDAGFPTEAAAVAALLDRAAGTN